MHIHTVTPARTRGIKPTHTIHHPPSPDVVAPGSTLAQRPPAAEAPAPPDSPVHNEPVEDSHSSSAGIHHLSGLIGLGCSLMVGLSGRIMGKYPRTKIPIQMKPRGSPVSFHANEKEASQTLRFGRRRRLTLTPGGDAKHMIARLMRPDLASTVRLARNQQQCDGDGRAEPDMAQRRVAPGSWTPLPPSIGFLMDLGLGHGRGQGNLQEIGNMRPAQDVDSCTSVGTRSKTAAFRPGQPTLPCRRHHRYGNADHQAPS
jgi:hypothetical protein